jgi:hypothetical protein
MGSLFMFMFIDRKGKYMIKPVAKIKNYKYLASRLRLPQPINLLSKPLYLHPLTNDRRLQFLNIPFDPGIVFGQTVQ